MKLLFLRLIVVAIAMSFQNCSIKKESSKETSSSSKESDIEEAVMDTRIHEEFGVFVGNDNKQNVKILDNGNPEEVTPQYVNDFFKIRDSVFTEINKTRDSRLDPYRNIDLNNSIDSVKIKDFMELCKGDKKGVILFIYGIEGKRLKPVIVGTKEIKESNFEIDKGSLRGQDFKNISHYLNFGEVLQHLKYPEYKDFDKPYIYYNKKTTLALLKKTKIHQYPDKYLYFYYGFVKNNNRGVHPAVLFSTKSQLFKQEMTNGDYAAFNRNSTCCPTESQND